VIELLVEVVTSTTIVTRYHSSCVGAVGICVKYKDELDAENVQQKTGIVSKGCSATETDKKLGEISRRPNS